MVCVLVALSMNLSVHKLTKRKPTQAGLTVTDIQYIPV